MTTSRSPEIPGILTLLARLVLRLAGWHAEGEAPDLPKFVMVAAPHTSNLDGVMMVVGAWYFRLKLNWVAKHTLFRPPFAGLLRALGGVPIDRDSPRRALVQMIKALRDNERQILVVAPEGTRHKTEGWKSGFYYIAKGANVPMVLAYLDYARKVVGIGPVVYPSGDEAADMRIIHEFYKDKAARYPEKRTLPLGDDAD